MASFNVDNFVSEPSVFKLKECVMRKDDWMKLADRYEVEYQRSQKKSVIQNAVISELVNEEVLPNEALSLRALDNRDAVEIRRLELEYEMREREKDKLHELSLKQSEAEEKERERQREAEEKERERQHELALLQIQSRPVHFDISKHLRLMPSFDEEDPEEFFMQFEKIAKSSNWPENSWIAMIQSVLTGSARSAFLSLSSEECKSYKRVKEEVLKTYELIPETYRVKFRTMRKSDSQSYIEFAYALSKVYTRWIKSSKVKTYEELFQLMLLEQFKRATPRDMQMYLEEREITDFHKAAALADSYALTHKTHPTKSLNHSGGKSSTNRDKGIKPANTGSSSSSNVKVQGKSEESTKTDVKAKTMICFYCKKPGHMIANCIKLKAKKEEQVLSFKPVGELNAPLVNNCPKEDSFVPFMFDGSVSKEESSDQYPVKILRDTGASHSIMLKSSLPIVEDSYTGEHVLLRGVCGVITVLLCRVYLGITKLVTGWVTVGVQDSLPVTGVTFLLGNDIAGHCVVPNPVVSWSPVVENDTGLLEEEYPDLFPLCAVTRSQTFGRTDLLSGPERCSADRGVPDNMNDLGFETLFDNQDDSVVCDLGMGKVNIAEDVVEVNPSESKASCPSDENISVQRVPVTRERLICDQQSDTELAELCRKAVDVNESVNEPVCYYMDSGLLMRKFRSVSDPAEDWNVVHQIVVPKCHREEILKLAHDLGGHLGVRKTYKKI